MNKLTILFFTFLTAWLTIACSQGESGAGKGDLIVVYEDSEPGVDAYQTRLLVNEKFLRMDDGVDDSSYTLLDRQKKIVYSVSHANQTVLKIVTKKTSDRVERKLVMDATKIEDGAMPEVGGKKPNHYQLTVNGNICANVIAVKGLHKELVQALGEFKRVLVGTHIANMTNTPKELQNECFLAHNIVSPSRTLQFGLPIFEEDISGKRRLLIDYKVNANTNETLYKLPEKYRIVNK